MEDDQISIILFDRMMDILFYFNNKCRPGNARATSHLPGTACRATVKTAVIKQQGSILKGETAALPPQILHTHWRCCGSCLKTGQHSIFGIIRKLIHVCWIPKIDVFMYIMEQYFHY